MFSSETLKSHLSDSPLSPIADGLISATNTVLNQRRHGDTEKWLDILHALPGIFTDRFDFLQDTILIGKLEHATEEQRILLKQQLLKLHPWRKGPFNLFGIDVDSEWRSDLKWARLQDKISPLDGKLILDVGCGNGYYIFRMLGAGAKYVLGVDPTQLFIAQFNAIQRFSTDLPAMILPLRSEELPFGSIEKSNFQFDTVFSMGVLYHRKKPLEHLAELKKCLKLGGELIIETLLLDGDDDNELVPEKTYAKMPNVWSVPTESKLKGILEQAGFKNISTIDVSTTNVWEQRKTEWMTFESLSHYLDPKDSAKTIEGYPAPKRIIVRCEN